MIPKKLKYHHDHHPVSTWHSLLLPGAKRNTIRSTCPAIRLPNPVYRLLLLPPPFPAKETVKTRQDRKSRLNRQLKMPQAGPRALPPVVRPQPLPCQSKQTPTGTECFRSIPGHFGLLSKSRDQCALKENALSILKAYEIDETKDTVTITCKVLSATKNRITVRYEGDCA